ncbi:27848_t:CDS:2 [Gigaspora margarita]|uniref:27848_t:CDS:1 n=1 Tax=Gigaspora margarita TaxID=4874 RepID=A0ABN7UJU1_GIGMA|nr:27848_t:CDS:2 [Gigaspora margarita]
MEQRDDPPQHRFNHPVINVKDFKVLGGLENRENVGSSREMLTEEDREIIRLLSEVLEDGLTEQDWLGMTPEERQELRETINDTYHFEG